MSMDRLPDELVVRSTQVGWGLMLVGGSGKGCEGLSPSRTIPIPCPRYTAASSLRIGLGRSCVPDAIHTTRVSPRVRLSPRSFPSAILLPSLAIDGITEVLIGQRFCDSLMMSA